MEKFDIYQDIMTRTAGDIYIGVVGPVRTGKSTFIKKFMEKLVIPNIEDENRRKRVIDELPQSAEGRTIMTTEPKFVPDGGVRVKFGDGLFSNIRLIDSVGYIVNDVEGYREGDGDRYVMTPWSDEKMSLRDAGEFGTKKVIVDHSTVGIVVTTDGSITDLERESYLESEERVIKDMQALGKPFVIVLNSADPTSESALAVQNMLESTYNVSVIPMNVASMTAYDADNILSMLLLEFPISGVEIDMPSYLCGLDSDNDIMSSIADTIVGKCKNMSKMSDYTALALSEGESEHLDNIVYVGVDFGTGIITYELKPKSRLFYDVISHESGVEIESDYELVNYIKRLKDAEYIYSKLGDAINEVNSTSYSVVMPREDEIEVSEPILSKKGSKCSVKLKATAPSLHIMKVDISTEICPLMGTEEQCNEMIEYINRESEEKGLMNVTLFSKPLDKLVNDAIESRTREVTADTRAKMVKTMTRIVNEGKGGVLCVLI